MTTNGTKPARATFTNRTGQRLIGWGVWLCTLRQNRTPWFATDHRAVGRVTLFALNQHTERVEMAKRHAKPSTRRRIG